MAEERTTQALPIEEINQLTKTLVDTMAEGTPKKIAKGLKHSLSTVPPSTFIARFRLSIRAVQAWYINTSKASTLENTNTERSLSPTESRRLSQKTFSIEYKKSSPKTKKLPLDTKRKTIIY